MLSDQDNALVLAEGATEDDRFYFAYFAMRVCNGLAAVGYPLCSGKYMAATAKWNQNVGRWKDYYTKWVASPEYNKLLSISVFMEIRCVYGNAELVDTLQNHLHETIHANPRFIPALTRDAIETSPPLGIFNSLVLEKSGDNTKSLNIKKFALNLIIDLARIYSLSAGGSLTGTEERFRYAVEQGTLSQDSCDNIIGAYRFLMQVRFRHQLNAQLRGDSPDNNIRPDEFSSFERKHLKEAFKIISELQDVAKLKFMSGF
jgi:CBS domain-containing protein